MRTLIFGLSVLLISSLSHAQSTRDSTLEAELIAAQKRIEALERELRLTKAELTLLRSERRATTSEVPASTPLSPTPQDSSAELPQRTTEKPTITERVIAPLVGPAFELDLSTPDKRGDSDVVIDDPKADEVVQIRRIKTYQNHLGILKDAPLSLFPRQADAWDMDVLREINRFLEHETTRHDLDTWLVLEEIKFSPVAKRVPSDPNLWSVSMTFQTVSQDYISKSFHLRVYGATRYTRPTVTVDEKTYGRLQGLKPGTKVRVSGRIASAELRSSFPKTTPISLGICLNPYRIHLMGKTFE